MFVNKSEAHERVLNAIEDIKACCEVSSISLSSRPCVLVFIPTTSITFYMVIIGIYTVLYSDSKLSMK